MSDLGHIHSNEEQVRRRLPVTPGLHPDQSLHEPTPPADPALPGHPVLSLRQLVRLVEDLDREIAECPASAEAQRADMVATLLGYAETIIQAASQLGANAAAGYPKTFA